MSQVKFSDLDSAGGVDEDVYGPQITTSDSRLVQIQGAVEQPVCQGPEDGHGNRRPARLGVMMNDLLKGYRVSHLDFLGRRKGRTETSVHSKTIQIYLSSRITSSMTTTFPWLISMCNYRTTVWGGHVARG